jgi:transposase
MMMQDHEPEGQTAIRTDLGAIFVSLELSRSSWLVISLSPGGGEKMSKHSIPSGDISGLLTLFLRLRERARKRTGNDFPIIVIQEAGLDGFWVHRVLEQEGIESHIVDAASVMTSRRRRRAKTDRIDGEALLRALMAYKRGEPRVCAMVRVPTAEEEDRRRISRERKTLTVERVAHVNRIKGLLFSQGITYEPLYGNRRARLEQLRTGDGRALPEHMKRQIKPRARPAGIASQTDQSGRGRTQHNARCSRGRKDPDAGEDVDAVKRDRFRVCYGSVVGRTVPPF